MRNIDFSDKIKKILKILALNQTGLAAKLGLSQGVISEFASGAREPSKEFLFGLSKLGISLDWFLTDEGEMFLSSQEVAKSPEGHKIPLLNQRVSCGQGEDWEGEQNIKGYIDIFSYIPSHKLGRLFAFPVHGNSMVGAGLRDGDYVLLYSNQEQYFPDDIYVFSLDGEVYCKQLEFDRISKKIKIYSIRVADMEKAELLTTLNIEDHDFAERFHLFGRVYCWVHPNYVGD